MNIPNLFCPPAARRRPAPWRWAAAALAVALTIPCGPAQSSTAAPAAQPAFDASPVAARQQPSPLAEGWQHGAFMEIFVRGWRDSNGDGIGDLKGLTQSLDYLRELGVKGLWLMPITASADHDHGYATQDYRAIEPAYGSLADFDELLREAHRRGIGVIMDYVVNHSAAEHPAFQAAVAGDARWRNWFVWTSKAPKGWDIWGKDPWYPGPKGDHYFATFGAPMPDFNLRNPEVVRFHEDSLRFWLNRGLDGFRLDAVPHLIENNAVDWNDQPESRALTASLVRLIKSYPRRHVVCEATAEPKDYAEPGLCGGAFAFGMEPQFIKAARGEPEAVAAVAQYFNSASPRLATMVSNHDIFAGQRLWDQAKGDITTYKLAAASYLLLPGTPFIYYGEEIGLGGVNELPGDGPLRSPMSWTADAKTAGFSSGQPFRPLAPNRAVANVQSQRADPGSIFNFYKALLTLRNEHPSIARGRYVAGRSSGAQLSFQRVLHEPGIQDHSLVLINYSDRPVATEVADLPAGARLQAAYPASASAATVGANGRSLIPMPARSVLVYQVTR